VTKKKLGKLTLRRETLTVLDLKAATGGAVVALNTVHSVCALCIIYPIIPPQEWTQTGG